MKAFKIVIVIFVCAILFSGCEKKIEISENAEETIVENLPEKIEEATTKAEAETETASEVEEAETKKTVSIVMVGDVLLHTPVSESGRLEDGSYNYDHLFSHVKETIENADIAIVNQEVILGGRDLGLSGYPCFNGAYEIGDALVNNGFDVVLHATNHTLDKGEKGVRNCLNFWTTNYPQIKIVGINESKEKQDNEIIIIEKNDIRIAILNYTYGTNGIEMSADAPYLVNLIDKEKIKKDVELAKTQSDFIIVCPHWGVEYQHFPSKEQEQLAEYFADLGVNLVIGTHPHVIEPVEWVEGENGNKTLVYYSLGNFVNATSGTGDGVADRMLGEIATINLMQSDEDIYIDSYDAIPIVSHLKSGIQGITVYPLDEYTKELEAENEIIKQDSHFSAEYLQNVWNEVKK